MLSTSSLLAIPLNVYPEVLHDTIDMASSRIHQSPPLYSTSQQYTNDVLLMFQMGPEIDDFRIPNSVTSVD
jgi:hypothetical protein